MLAEADPTVAATKAGNAHKLIDHLDQSVLAKTFGGELVPQEPNDEPASRGSYSSSNPKSVMRKLAALSRTMVSIAADTYNSTPSPGTGGVTWIDWLQTRDPSFVSAHLTDAQNSGFYAVIYQRDDNTLVIAFRGTVGGPFGPDWKANIEHVLGLPTEQYTLASQLAAEVVKLTANTNTKVFLTGHSLGGGLAATAGAQYGLPTITLNPTGVTDKVLQSNTVLNILVQGGGVSYGGVNIGTSIQLTQSSTYWQFASPSPADPIAYKEFWHDPARIFDVVGNKPQSIRFLPTPQNGQFVIDATVTN